MIPRTLGNMVVLTNFVETEHLQTENFFPYVWLGKKDYLMLLVNEQFKSIKLNAQHVTGMTPFDSAVHMYDY